MQANAVEGYHTAFMLCPYRAPVGTFIIDGRLIGIRRHATPCPVAAEYGTASERLFRARALPTSVTIFGEGAEAANFRFLRAAVYCRPARNESPKGGVPERQNRRRATLTHVPKFLASFSVKLRPIWSREERVGVQHIDVGLQPRSELPCCLSLATSKEVHELPARDGFGTDIRLR
jgi:hypothetical protein